MVAVEDAEFRLELTCLVDCAGTADWRRRIAERFPADSRNSEAAKILDRLAVDLDAHEGGPLHRKLAEHWEQREDFHEIVSEELRSLGFSSLPESAAELLQNIISHFD
jgi:hypothetical protein